MSYPDLRLRDARDVDDLLAEIDRLAAGYLPDWRPAVHGPDGALNRIGAGFIKSLLDRINQAPGKNRLAFFDLLGVRLTPAGAAGAVVVCELSPTADDTRLRLEPGTRLAAAPPPGGTAQITFETDRGLGLSAARLDAVFSVWPGRDEYIDHSAAIRAKQPIQPFRRADLQAAPHELYIGHGTLLALAGKSRTDLEFELRTPSGDPLDLVWEYWDGEVWRSFRGMRPSCETGERERQDGTIGLTRAGTIRLESGCAETSQTSVNGVKSFWIRGRLDEAVLPDPARVLPEVESVRLSAVIDRQFAIEKNEDGTIAKVTAGLRPDGAFADALALDLTKPFYPLGLQPQPGSTFYFSCEEAFSKPGAIVTLAIQRTTTPQDNFSGSAATTITLAHTVTWEYWNGRQWVELPPVGEYTAAAGTSTTAAEDFTSTDVELVTFSVPADFETSTVNDVKGRWIRVRLTSGGYGFTHTVQWKVDGTANPNQFTYVIPRPPALSLFAIGYTWQHGPFHPEHVVTHNDFTYEDRTEEARWPGRSFLPFRPMTDVTPALYLGFTRKLPVDLLGLYLDVVEQAGEVTGPSLLWEYWDGSAWESLAVEDETRHLRVPGVVSLIGPEGSRALTRFGQSRHWLRARLKEDGPPGESTIAAMHLNAVWSIQRQTISDDPLGTSTGQPNQVFVFRQVPVLPGEWLEVRELAGARANTEWRSLALDVLRGDLAVVRAIEKRLGSEQPDAELAFGDLRLRRDRNKRVTEVWVRWQERPHLLESGPADRHYALERARSRAYTGDEIHGRIPPAGAAVVARRYQTGGGAAGNVAAESIKQLLGASVPADKVFNPRRAEGGADGETLGAFSERAPHAIRHRGRAVSVRDYETLAKEASPAVARARALAGRDPAGHRTPGWVTLVITPHAEEPRPWPSFGLRQKVARFVADRASADLAAARRVHVTGPSYVSVDVRATVAPRDAGAAGAVERAARQTLESFLHPLRGGPRQDGWMPGRAPYQSDIATALERLDGVDHVEELALFVGGVQQSERVRIPDDGVVAAGEIRVKVIRTE